MPMVGSPPLQDTVVLNAPVATGDVPWLGNPSGRTTVRATSSDQVCVEAVGHYWSTSNPPEIRQVPGAGTLSVGTTQPFAGPCSMSYIDYVIDVPAGADADIGATNGM
jgi:hypothetical protein